MRPKSCTGVQSLRLSTGTCVSQAYLIAEGAQSRARQGKQVLKLAGLLLAHLQPK